MILAVYLMAGWISQISAINAAEQTVQQLEEQPGLCKIDISTRLQLDETSRPWDRPVNTITDGTPVARQTSLGDSPTATALGAAQRTDSPFIPLTIDGTVPVKSSIDDTASYNILTVEGPVGDANLVNGVAAISPDPLSPKVALMIENPSRKRDQGEVAAALDFVRPCSAIALTIDGLVVDTASANGVALGLDPSITDPLTISGEKASSKSNESGQTIPLTILVHPINRSTLTGFDCTEIHQAISAPQNTISGVISRGQSPAGVTRDFVLWGFMFWYIGLFVYFLGHICISLRSSWGLSRTGRCANVEAVVNDSPNWFSSLRRYLYRGSDHALRGTLKHDAPDGEPKASDLQAELPQLQLDFQADQKTTEIATEDQNESPEKLIMQIKTLEAEKKQSEEYHSQQLTEKQRELNIVQKDKSSLAEANMLLRDRLDRKVVSENKKQKDLELAREEKNRITEAYRVLHESTDSKIAAGAVKDRQIEGLGRELESAKLALELKSTEKEKSNASDEKKITELSQQLKETKSTLEEKTADANSSKFEADTKIYALESELRDCRSQLDAIAADKEDSDAKSKEKTAGLKFLVKISKSVATRETAEKDVYKSELQQCRSAVYTKTAEIDASRPAKTSETSTLASGTHPLQERNANHPELYGKTLISWADDCDDLISSNDMTINNSAEETLTAGQSLCKTTSSDIGDFSRSTVDIFEDLPLSNRKATANFRKSNAVAGTSDANGKPKPDLESCSADSSLEAPLAVKGTVSKPKDGVVKKGRGFLRKKVSSPGRLFNYGSK
ncbi:hypothetical protein G7Y79_00020g048280 [Physcia stellaris]|nr:hypothetical protein G7Y79_00020g048280 [Physcia stellaris]